MPQVRSQLQYNAKGNTTIVDLVNGQTLVEFDAIGGNMVFSNGFEISGVQVPTGDIAPGAVGTTQLAAGSVTTAKVAAAAITIATLGTITDGTTLDQSGTGSSLEIKAGGVGPSQLGSVADGVTLDQSGSGSTLEIKAAGVGTSQIANLAVTTALIAANAVTTAKIANSAVGQGQLAVYVESAATPAPMLELEIDVPDAASGNVDTVLSLTGAGHFKVEDVFLIVNSTNGSNANTIQVDNGTGGAHISDAMSTNGLSANTIVRCASINLTNWSVANGGTIRIVRTRAGGACAAKVMIRGHLEA